MLLRSLFAPRCAACDAPLECSSPMCTPCTESLWPIEAACPRCALPIEGEHSVLCRRCRLRGGPIARATAPFRYGGELAVALRRLKYSDRADLARQLSPLFSTQLTVAAAICDRLIPVPLHWRRRSARGYNQAQTLLLRGLPRQLRRKVDTSTLVRRLATAPQTGLAARVRADNVRNAFQIRRRRQRRLRGQTVLLFDDVVTTGATVRAAARTLLRAGAAQVIVFSVARASA